MKKTHLFLIMGGIIIALASCSSGGGGGSDGSGMGGMGGMGGQKPPQNIFLNFQDASQAEVNSFSSHSEYSHQAGLGTIGASYLYARGKKNKRYGFGSGTGAGVVAGVWDEGLDHFSTNFKNRISAQSILGYEVDSQDDIANYQIASLRTIVDVTDSFFSPLTDYPAIFCPRGFFEIDMISCPDDSNTVIIGSTLFVRYQGKIYRLPRAGYYYFGETGVTDNGGGGVSEKIRIDDDGELYHGTFVSSILGAARGEGSNVVNGDIHGVAFETNIVFLAIDFDNTPGFSPYEPIDLTNAGAVAFMNGLRHGVLFFQSRASVVNMSFGPNGLTEFYEPLQIKTLLAPLLTAFAQRATPAADRTIYVVAAGNNHQATQTSNEPLDASSPQILAGLAYAEPLLRGIVIPVVAIEIDSQGQAGAIAGFSNRCGITQDYCLAAPGAGHIRGLAAQAFNEEGEKSYESYLGQGTSFAAPFVSGAITALIDYFNGQLGNDEIVQRLFATANRSGIYADASIYGRGLIDLKKASEPFGETRLTLSEDLQGSSFSLRQSHFYMSHAFSALSGLNEEWFVVFDELDAPFPITLNAIFPHHSQANIKLASRPLPQTPSQSLSQSLAQSLPFLNMDIAFDEARGAFFSQYQQDKKKLFYSYRTHPDFLLGERLNISPTRHYEFLSPFLALVDDGLALGGSFELANMDIRLSGFFNMPEVPTPQSATFYQADNGIGFGAHASSLFQSVMVSFSPRNHPEHLTIQMGMLNERHGLLGGRAQGALDIEEALSGFVGAISSWRWGQWQALASFHFGVTHARLPNHFSSHDSLRTGLLQNISHFTASAASLGIAYFDLITHGDRLSLFISQPLTIESGHMSLTLPKGRSRYKKLRSSHVELDLSSPHRQIESEISYVAPLSWYGALALSSNVISQPRAFLGETIEVQSSIRWFRFF